MIENPYESPKGMEPTKRRTADNRKATIVFSFFAVPIGAIAGAGACLGSPGRFELATDVLLGISAMIGVLITAHCSLQCLWAGTLSFNGWGAAIGLAAATPVALIIGHALALLAYDIATRGGRPGPHLLVGVFIAFFVWSLGFWIGLQWRVWRRAKQPGQQS